MRAAIERVLAEVGAPGCSIAAVDASGLIMTAAFGYADVGQARPARPDTAYRLFSGTKLFTAVAVLQLVERGMLALENTVEQFVPEAGAARGVTVQQLLSHQSGLKDTLRAFLAVTLPPERVPTSAEALARYRLVVSRPPGERVEYRNVNYALLGEVVSRVSGMEYREYVRRNVLEPLGMEADFAIGPALRDDVATGYIGRWDPMRFALGWILPGMPARLYGRRIGGLIELREYQLATSAIGGLIGSMPAMARFLQAQLEPNRGILSAELTRRMQTQVAAGAAGIESRVGVGLGWKIGRAGGRPFINHEGGGAGFTTELRLYPEQGIGIALGMNQMRMPHTMRAAHRICETVLTSLITTETGAHAARPASADT